MQPGPLLFERSGELVWTLLASLFIGLVVLVILNMQFAVLWAKKLYIPRHYLYAGITVLSMLGVYAISSAILDLWVVLALAVSAVQHLRHRRERAGAGGVGGDGPGPQGGEGAGPDAGPVGPSESAVAEERETSRV